MSTYIPPNLSGQIGERCAMCSGYGKLAKAGSGSLSPCERCGCTGIEPQSRITQLEREVEYLKAQLKER